MKDGLEMWYDPEKRISAVFADASSAAQTLADAHLSGPAAAYFLTKGLCAAALLSRGLSGEETVLVQVSCDGPLESVCAECTADGRLRGFTGRKTLDGFDAAWPCDPAKAAGSVKVCVSRTAPGRLLSRGVSNSFDGYLASSLQIRARMFLEASVSPESRILEARGLLIEALPDSGTGISSVAAPLDEAFSKRKAGGILAKPQRKILSLMGLSRPERRESAPLAFGCRCSRERALASFSALDPGEKENLPETVSVVCHACGRTYSFRKKELEAGE